MGWLSSFGFWKGHFVAELVVITEVTIIHLRGNTYAWDDMITCGWDSEDHSCDWYGDDYVREWDGGDCSCECDGNDLPHLMVTMVIAAFVNVMSMTR